MTDVTHAEAHRIDHEKFKWSTIYSWSDNNYSIFLCTGACGKADAMLNISEYNFFLRMSTHKKKVVRLKFRDEPGSETYHYINVKLDDFESLKHRLSYEGRGNEAYWFISKRILQPQINDAPQRRKESIRVEWEALRIRGNNPQRETIMDAVKKYFPDHGRWTFLDDGTGIEFFEKRDE